MVYKDFEELNKDYDKERSDMNFEEELCYVTDCFDTYEALGFKDTFESPYEDKASYNGQVFTVTGRLLYSEGEADIECLPMWHIKFNDGTEIDAYPEEICIAENN